MPSLEPPDRPLAAPTWRGVLAGAGLVAAIPLLLWTLARPLAGTVVLAGLVGLFVGGRGAYRLIRCLYECRGFTLHLGRAVRITVSRIPERTDR